MVESSYACGTAFSLAATQHSAASPSIRPPVSTICFVNLQKFTNFDHVDTPINFLFLYLNVHLSVTIVNVTHGSPRVQRYFMELDLEQGMHTVCIDY